MNAEVFLKRAAKVIPYPIRNHRRSGRSAPDLHGRGAHSAGERPQAGDRHRRRIHRAGDRRRLRAAAGGKPPHGLRQLRPAVLPGRRDQQNNFRRARLAAAQKLETLAWQYRIQGWQYALGASGTIKAAHEVLVAMGKKTVSSPWIAWKCSPSRCCSSKASAR